MHVTVPTCRRVSRPSLYEEAKYVSAQGVPFRFKNERIEVAPDCELDPVWFAQACRYITSLTQAELMTLYVYSSPAFGFVNMAVSGSDRWLDDVRVPTVEEKWLSVVFDMLTEPNHKRYMTHVLPVGVYRLRAQYSMSKSKADADGLEAQMNTLIRAHRASFTAAFWKEVAVRAGRDCTGIMFYPQLLDLARTPGMFIESIVSKRFASMRLGAATLDDCVAVMADITPQGWKTIVQKYIASLSQICDGCPALTQALNVYRGTPGVKVRTGRSFMSASLSIAVATEFIDARKNCCVHRLHLRPGQKPLPVMCVSRYPHELEILLVPDVRYRKRSG